MVKLPSFDDLKKLGSDLVDATKSINIKEVVDHFKSGAATLPSDEATQLLFHNIRTTLQELNKAQPNQEALIKKLEHQVTELEKIMGSKTEDKR